MIFFTGYKNILNLRMMNLLLRVSFIKLFDTILGYVPISKKSVFSKSDTIILNRLGYIPPLSESEKRNYHSNS